ncbi:unnamed protein product, partial [Polarella glacialis]
ELPEGSRCAVCMHRHARAFSLETTPLPVDDWPCVHYTEVFDFGSGCLCCSPDGDLSRLLVELSSKQDELRLTHMFIETTGVADPRPFISLFTNQVASAFKLEGVIGVVDLVRAPNLLASSKEAPSIGSRGAVQLSCTDLLVFNKLDELQDQQVLEQVAATQELVLAKAMGNASVPDELSPILLDPCAFARVTYKEIHSSLGKLHARRRHSTSAGPCPLP